MFNSVPEYFIMLQAVISQHFFRWPETYKTMIFAFLEHIFSGLK